MVRAGIVALEFFTPGKGLAGWGQAHMMARHAILNVHTLPNYIIIIIIINKNSSNNYSDVDGLVGRYYWRLVKGS